MSKIPPHYTIYLVYKNAENNNIGKRLFGGDRAHTALMLAEETEYGPKGLFQLDGVSYQADRPKGGDNGGGRKLNILSAACETMHLQGAFHKAVKFIGKDQSLARLKVRETVAKRNPNDVEHFAIASGKPRDMMKIWLAACEGALEINKADKPFMTAGLGDILRAKSPRLAFGQTARNCQTVAGSLAETMGMALYPEWVKGYTTPGLQRKLSKEIPALAEIHPNKDDDLTMEQLLERRADLSAKIKESCRIIKGKKDPVYTKLQTQPSS